MATSLLSIPVQTIDGQDTSLSNLAGKVFLVVNVASKCGFTLQYTGLEQLYQQFKDRGLVILGFPANDFGAQEPGTNAEIAQFCSVDYPVSFPLFSKITVTGPEKHPLYAELTSAQPDRISKNDELISHLSEYAAGHGFPPPNKLPEVLWNFEKFLVDRDGNIIARFNPDIEPNDPLLIQAIEAALV
jgi:glutathione peroxidase